MLKPNFAVLIFPPSLQRHDRQEASKCVFDRARSFPRTEGERFPGDGNAASLQPFPQEVEGRIGLTDIWARAHEAEQRVVRFQRRSPGDQEPSF